MVEHAHPVGEVVRRPAGCISTSRSPPKPFCRAERIIARSWSRAVSSVRGGGVDPVLGEPLRGLRGGELVLPARRGRRGRRSAGLRRSSSASWAAATWRRTSFRAAAAASASASRTPRSSAAAEVWLRSALSGPWPAGALLAEVASRGARSRATPTATARRRGRRRGARGEGSSRSAPAASSTFPENVRQDVLRSTNVVTVEVGRGVALLKRSACRTCSQSARSTSARSFPAAPTASATASGSLPGPVTSGSSRLVKANPRPAVRITGSTRASASCHGQCGLADQKRRDAMRGRPRASSPARPGPRRRTPASTQAATRVTKCWKTSLATSRLSVPGTRGGRGRRCGSARGSRPRIHVGHAGQPQRLERGVAGTRRGLELLVERGEHLLTDRVEQGPLVGEVQVDRRCGYPDPGGDRPDRDGILRTRLGEQVPGRDEDLIAEALALAAPGADPAAAVGGAVAAVCTWTVARSRHRRERRADRVRRAGSLPCSSLSPMRACRRRSGPGAHQLIRPVIRMKAGTSAARTRVASTITASASPMPIILMKVPGTSRC